MATQQELPLAAPVPSGLLSINARCALRAEGEHRVVVVAGLPVHHSSVHDAVAEAYAMVFLAAAGYATQREAAAALGCSERTLRRHQERYHDGGMAALATRSGWRPGRRRVPAKRLRIIEGLPAEGMSNREMARRMGVTEEAIRQAVGPSERRAQQQLLPLDTPENTGGTASPMSLVTVAAAPLEHPPPSPMGQALPLVSPEEKAPPPASPDQAVSAEPEPVAMSLDSAPANRTWDRLLACFGLLDDAAPVFGNGQAVPGAAVLGAVPGLVANGVFGMAHQVYGEIGPAFYGLRTMRLTLLLMALWRVKRPETLKEDDPQILGFLYLDGHVRVYHGQGTIPKAHVARMRLSMPATTGYWVNDQAGDPLWVITAAANAGMVKRLPEVLNQVRKLAGDRRVTVVFDRGGWSPKLFQKLLEANFGLLTYRKGKSRRIAAHRFVVRRAQIGGRTVEYRLHDQAVRFLKGKLRLRQVIRLSDDGRQTQVITSRWDLADSSCSTHSPTTRWSPTTPPAPCPIPSDAPWTRTSAALGPRWPS